MPYGVVLKDERRTLNIERPMQNENKYQILPSFPIQYSMLDVRCSTFIFSVLPSQKQLSAYAAVTAAYSMETDSPAGGAETFTCGAFS